MSQMGHKQKSAPQPLKTLMHGAYSNLAEPTLWWWLRLIGLGLLMVVVLTHVAERFHIFAVMGWGQPDSAGHYLNLVSAIFGCALLLVGLLGRALGRH